MAKILDLKWLVLAIIYTILLIYLTLSNANQVLPEVEWQFSDKAYHFIAFVILAVLWGIVATKSPNAFDLKKAFCSTLIFGIVLELLQQWINPVRTTELLDLMANCAGVCVGTIVVALIRRSKVKII